MKIFFKIKCIVFLNCLIVCLPIFAKIGFVDSKDPPAGFESMHIQQHLGVSVLFMNQPIGFFYIDLKQGQLKFYAPKRLLSQLVGVKNNKDVLHLLNQSFPLNIECHTNKIVSAPRFCGNLKKQPAYIIYDPQKETVYLYIAPSYFEKPKKNDTIDFIPNSSSGLSYINKLGIAGSFNNNDDLSSSRIYASLPNYYNLYSNNTVAYKNSSLIGNISQNNGIDDGQHFQIQNLYAQHINQDKVYTGGYILSFASPFFQTQTLIGGGIQTTLETVKNSENIMATPLVIFVPQASQVNIFKNEKIIFSEYLEAGYQSINTSGFPDGGYELIIKIGSNNTIYRFFTKGFALPPKHAPQFYVMGGYLTNEMVLDNNVYSFLPHTLNTAVLQAGITKRLSEQVAFFSDVLLSSDQGLLDFGPVFFFGNSFIKTAGLFSTKNNYGIYAMFNAQKNKLNLSLIATKIFYQKKNFDYFFLNNLTDNDSISMSYNVSEEDLLGVQGNYNKILDQPQSYNTGIFYQRRIGNYKGMSFFFNTAYNKAIYIGDTYSLNLSVNFSKDRIAGTESLGWQNQIKNSSDNQYAVPIVGQGSTVYSQQNEQNIGYALNEIHTISPSVSSLAGIYNYTSQQSFVATYANYNYTKNQGHTMGYGGNIETEFAINKNGAGFNGVERGNASGVILKVNSDDSEDKSSKFALIDENNRKIAILPINKKVFISLRGFTDQNYTLINLSKVDYFIKKPTRHITLYPGNVDYYSWSVEKRIILIGRAMIKHKNRPLTNTWIHAGQHGVFSDDEGNFQLELSQTTKILMGGDSCQIKLPPLNKQKNYLYMGDVMCS